MLFDEIEKAAPSMTRLLLGVLDKAVLRLGDNTTVNFERTLIFLTSNLGAEAMRKHFRPDFGFETMTGSDQKAGEETGRYRHERGAAQIFAGVREPDRRGDHVSAAKPGRAGDYRRSADDALEQHIEHRLMERAFELEVSDGAREFLLAKEPARNMAHAN